jgi:hypothetical protein
MCGRPPGCKRKIEKSDGRFDCDHVSGLFGAATWPPAQMGSAIQPQTNPRLRKPLTRTDSLDRRFDRLSSLSALIPTALTGDLCCPNTVMALLVRAIRLRPVRCRMARTSPAMTVKGFRVSAKGRWYHTLASTRGSGGDRTMPVCPATRHLGPCRTGHPVAQSRPKPCGGSIA